MSDITANVVVSMPSQLFTMARSFKAVANGKIYIGKIDTDPVNPENQIQVYVENEDGSHVPVSQPIIINAAGYPVYNGQIAKFVTMQGHSMAVYDAYGAQQFYFPNVLKYDPDQFRGELNSNEGAGLVGYDESINYGKGTVGASIGPYAANGGTNKYSREVFAERVISSDDFGDPLVDTGASINEGIAQLQSSLPDANTKGGVLQLPRGVRLVSTEIHYDDWNNEADQIDSIEIKGKGISTSELRAGPDLPSWASIIKNTTSTSSTKATQYFKLNDFATRGGYHGISHEFASRGTIDRVKAFSASQNGFYFGNTFILDIRNIIAGSNSASGVKFDYLNNPIYKQHTSTVVTSGYASSNGNNGWEWGYMNYCSAISTASDSNVNHGHYIRNCDCFVMTSCGAESNGRAGFAARSNDTEGYNENVVIEGAFAHVNNMSKDGWANLLHVQSLNSVKNNITIRNSKSSPSSDNNSADIIVDGIGAIATIDNCTIPKGVQTFNGGYVDWVHHNILFPAINFTGGAAREICSLRSTQGYQTTYGGMIIVHVGNLATSTGARRTATYILIVNKSISGVPIVNLVSSAGETSGENPSSPSFTWSINGADKLVASGAKVTTAGDFWFEITTSGQVIVN
ncbi:phage head-binding domain-containing protein [Escherichia marmotae]|nr:phage head-binding domain-containing protein [Escherichia marmotae]MEC9836181.1 phage head-binding domain-containing protein [Escherichia marmotae]MEC9937110.1 phage head-binding domain-containing protein [Escherichia marmotae]MED9242475.1 phage head-binding domain-containing protein [Escherichia marmotae]